MIGIILGLVGWINQAYIVAEWRWWTVARPYILAKVRPYVLTAAQERRLKAGDTFKECAQDCPEMIVVPSGSFMMGSPNTEPDRQPTEEPQHIVTFAKPFAISKYELTFDDWDTCVNYGDCTWHPSDAGWGRGQQPVIYVSWDDAKQYIAWLAKVTGQPYRLLSESEYEYATRAGTTTAFPWGDDIGENHANCSGCGSKWDDRQTAPVGSFAPNKFGLYDMVGNVFEWVEDCAHVSYDDAPTDGSAWIEGGNCRVHVARGGCWNNSPNILRSAFRYGIASNSRMLALGIRIGRTLSDGAGAITVAPGVR